MLVFISPSSETVEVVSVLLLVSLVITVGIIDFELSVWNSKPMSVYEFSIATECTFLVLFLYWMAVLRGIFSLIKSSTVLNLDGKHMHIYRLGWKRLKFITTMPGNQISVSHIYSFDDNAHLLDATNNLCTYFFFLSFTLLVASFDRRTHSLVVLSRVWTRNLERV